MRNIFFFLLVGVTILLASCGARTEETTSITPGFCVPDSLMANITLDTVRSGYVMSDLKLSGKISFNEDDVEKVFPVVSGHVTEVKVSLGDYVQKGQLLATVRSSDMANYFDEYHTAESQLAVAKKNMEVSADMRKSGITSDRDYLTAQSEYNKALADFNKIKEVLKIYGGEGSENDPTASTYRIKAPISGFIVEKNVNTGMELRADDASNLFTISDLHEVWAVANVYETDISKIKI